MSPSLDGRAVEFLLGLYDTIRNDLLMVIEESRRDRNHNAIWIRSLLAQGIKPNIQLLETVGDDGREAEIKWILYGRYKGWNLTNCWGREPIRENHKYEFNKYNKLFKMSNLT